MFYIACCAFVLMKHNVPCMVALRGTSYALYKLLCVCVVDLSLNLIRIYLYKENTMSKEMREHINKVKNFGQFLNETIKNEIESLIDDYITNNQCEIIDINHGLCDEFAYDMLDIVGGESETSFLISNNIDYDEDYGLNYYDLNDKRYYKKFTTYKGDINNITNSDHVWLYHNGRHYDAETPNGVVDYLHLPFFKRYMKMR